MKQKTKICKHNTTHKIDSVNNINLYKCKDCEIILSDRYKEGYDIKKVYTDYYRNEIVGRFLYGVEYVVKAFRLFRAFKIHKLNPHAKSILDIGSGRGYMLYFLRKHYGIEDVVGTQIEDNSYIFSKKVLKLNIFNKDLLDIKFNKNRFDTITMWHVLEHVREPEKYIMKFVNLLKKGGNLIIEVPNYDSWSRRLTGKYWLGLDLDYHLYFFDTKSLIKLLEKYNFEIKKVHTFSLEYSVFTSTQSLVSWITKTDHLFFKLIQNGKISGSSLISIPLFIFLFPVCLVINMVLYNTMKGEIILVVAQKK
jgi:2-polyprenyl-3-methyl-5-hydroxy-6-metoxy-1,4-benzoquinol methylase